MSSSIWSDMKHKKERDWDCIADWNHNQISNFIWIRLTGCLTLTDKIGLTEW